MQTLLNKSDLNPRLAFVFLCLTLTLLHMFVSATFLMADNQDLIISLQQFPFQAPFH